MKITLFRSLTQRSFAFLWSGQAISALGDSLYRVALAWWVLEKTGSATIMGIVLIFSFIPMLLFLLIGGVAVDRFSRLQVMLISDTLRGVIVLTMALLGFAQHLEVWHVYIASVLFGLVDAFFQPAYAAVIPEIMPQDLLPSANSLTVLSRQTFSVVGPALGALIIALGNTSAAFVCDGLTFVFSACCLLMIRQIPAPDARGKSEAPGREPGIIADLREGIGTVIASPWIWITIVVSALANITQSAPFSVSLPFLVTRTWHANVQVLGTLYSVYFLGSVLGAIWLGHAKKLRRRGPLAYFFVILSGLMTLSLGLPLPVGGMFVTALIRGLSFTAFELVWVNTLQELVPGKLLGRVASIDYLGSFALLPLGYAIAGRVTDLVGPPAVFLIGGLITISVAMLGITHPVVRRVD